jgi:hypothetical protein
MKYFLERNVTISVTSDAPRGRCYISSESKALYWARGLRSSDWAVPLSLCANISMVGYGRPIWLRSILVGVQSICASSEGIKVKHSALPTTLNRRNV